MPSTYELITEQVIKALETGTAPWQRPWASELPMNLISQKEYRGLNVFTLAMAGYASRYWLSYRQALKLGGHVRKNEKGSPVVFWQVGEEKLNAKTGKLSRAFLLRHSTVFNLNQCDDLDLPKSVFEHAKKDPFQAIEAAESIVAKMPNPPKFEQSGSAWYRPSTDTVGLPARETFHTPAGFYSTAFHELAHSTGHTSRLHRPDFDNPMHFGSETYSREELCAELTASYLAGVCGIERETLPNSSSYLANWIKVLRGDSRLIVGASSQAQKASDFILNRTAEPVADPEPVVAD